MRKKIEACIWMASESNISLRALCLGLSHTKQEKRKKNGRTHTLALHSVKRAAHARAASVCSEALAFTHRRKLKSQTSWRILTLLYVF